jgi:pyridoxine 5-phosphate synthase
MDRLRLGVNIDHVATIRNARGGRHPDPVRAAKLAIAAGCDGITAHLREDRRHIRDDDIARLKAELDKPLNFEMAATDEMIGIALKTKPHAACLVPESRTERTTEGGLDAVGQRSQLAPAIRTLKAAGIRVSLFIGAAPAQIEMAAELGTPAVEIHTGGWCDALAERRMREAEAEWQIIRDGAERASGLGLEVHAGHGLDYGTAETIAALPQVVELNIGHFLIGESVFEGLVETIKFMRAAMDRGRKKARA